MIIAEKSYEVSDPTIDSQVVQLKDSGADIFFNMATPKVAAQAIRKVGELGWRPKCNSSTNVSASIGGVLKPAGYDSAKGIISTAYLKDPTDPDLEGRSGDERMAGFHEQILSRTATGPTQQCLRLCRRQGLVQVLKQCGDELTRENVMKQAANLELPDRHAAAGHHDQHQPERLLSDRADAADALRWRELAAVRAA